MSQIAGIGCLLLLAAGIASADQPSPYLGQEHREIKALSPQETQDYLEGKGMGFAKAAELNRFPGPLHVLQLADKLRLTPDQKLRTEQLHAAVQKEAKALGKALVGKERELDQLFAVGQIDSVTLRLLVTEIGFLQAEVRKAHLQAHLEQKAMLTPVQVAAYAELRGYTSGRSSDHPHSSNHH